MKVQFVVLGIFLSTASIAGSKKTGHNHGESHGQREKGSHEHGKAVMSIARNTPVELQVLFESPGESILGFEHKSKSKKEKEIEKSKLEQLKGGAKKWIEAAPLADCIVKDSTAKVEHDGDHSEVRLSYKIQCSQAIPSKMQAKFNLFGAFSDLREIKVVTINESTQAEHVLAKSKDSIELQL